MKYTIKKGYRVFELGATDPIDEADEQALYGWLRNRGMSAAQAVALIEKVDPEGEAQVSLPIYPVRRLQ